MMSVKDFIIEILVGCSSQEVREVAYQQFTNLINMTTPAELNPKKFLTQVQHFSIVFGVCKVHDHLCLTLQFY